MTDTTPDEAVEPELEQTPAIADEAAADEAIAHEGPAPSTRDVALRADDSIDARIRYSRELTAAGDLLPKALRNAPGKVLLIVETARALGVPAVMGLSSINVIEGKPSISPALMSALVRRAGHRLRVRSTGTVEGGDYSVTATLIRADDPEFPFESTWTPHRAERAGLCSYRQTGGKWVVVASDGNGKPKPWQKYTEAMCKARAIGEVCREGAEDALMGAHYTPEELGAIVNEEGDLVEAPVVRESIAAPERRAEPAGPTPEQLANTILHQCARFTTLADLTRYVREETPIYVGRQAWAPDYASMAEYATRTMVTTTALGRVPLSDAIAYLERRLRGEDGPQAPEGGSSRPDEPQEPQAPAGEPEAPPAEREVHVITTAPERPRDDEDPWAGGRAGGDPTHDEAIANVAGALGGEVLSSTTIDADGVERENAKRARHDTETARRARAEAEASWNDETPPTEGAGRAAFNAAREKLRTNTTEEK